MDYDNEEMNGVHTEDAGMNVEIEEVQTPQTEIPPAAETVPPNSQAPRNYPVTPQPQNNYGPGGTGQYQYQPQPEPEKNGMAIAALVMGILSLLCCCCGYAGFAFGALGIILALLSKKDAPMCSNAKIALILSSIGLALTVITIIIILIAQAGGMLMEGMY